MAQLKLENSLVTPMIREALERHDEEDLGRVAPGVAGQVAEKPLEVAGSRVAASACRTTGRRLSLPRSNRDAGGREISLPTDSIR